MFFLKEYWHTLVWQGTCTFVRVWYPLPKLVL